LTLPILKSPRLTAFSGRVVRFGVSGVLSTLVAYVTFMVGLRFWHYAIAAVFSWVISVAFGFLVNRRFTFRIKGRENGARDAVLFIIGALLQLGLALIGYHVMLDILSLNATVAFAINLIFTSAFSFGFMSLVIFRRAAKPATGEGSV
jgi:putative flippase GtrA